MDHAPTIASKLKSEDVCELLAKDKRFHVVKQEKMREELFH